MNRVIYGFSNCEKPPHLTGEFSQYTYIHPRSWVFKIPDEVPEELRVLVEPAAVATRAVERANSPGVTQVGEGYGVGSSVVVLGAGPIGLMIVAALRHTGAGRIIVTDAVDSRLQMAKRLGADEAINVIREKPEERLQRVLDQTEGVGADIVIEAAGVPAAFKEAIDLVRRGGIVIEVGHYTDSGNVQVSPHQICRKDIDIRGVWSYPPIQFKIAIDFLAQAPLKELITHRLPLDRLVEGIDMLGNEGVLKVVIEP
jgi:L-iditol 2-dehydrogenase